MSEKIIDLYKLARENNFILEIKSYSNSKIALIGNLSKYRFTFKEKVNLVNQEYLNLFPILYYFDSFKIFERISKDFFPGYFEFFSITKIQNIQSGVNKDIDYLKDFPDLELDPHKFIVFGEQVSGGSLFSIEKETGFIYEINCSLNYSEKIFDSFDELLSLTFDTLGESSCWLRKDAVHTKIHGSRRLTKNNIIPSWFFNKYSYLIDT